MRKNKRLINTYIFFIILFMILIYRLYKFTYYGTYNGVELSALANSQYCYKEKVSELNYEVLDRKGKDLLTYDDKYYVVIDPNAFKGNEFKKDNDNLYAAIALLKNYNSSYDIGQIGVSYEKKRFEVDRETYDKIKSLKAIKGLYAYRYQEIDRSEANKIENILTYPVKASGKAKDKSSLESILKDKTKDNSYTYIAFQKDLNNNITGSSFDIPKNNVNVILTLDKDIQESIRNKLKKYNYDDIGVALMESSTGKLISLCQKNEDRANVLISAGMKGFQPASTFKVIVLETAIDQGIIKKNDIFTCKGEKDEPSHGTLNPGQALNVSCNSIFEQIGSKVTYDKFTKMAKDQGLFKKVLYLDNESEGFLEVPNKGEDREKSFSIGHKMGVTPLQLLTIANTAITGGYYIKPTIIDSYTDVNGKEIERVEPYKKEVLKPETASYIKQELIDTVKNGTGVKAKVAGIEMGGKTGTSERTDNGNHNDGWFTGFFKINNKYYTMVVFLKDIRQGEGTAGDLCAPIYKDIVEYLTKELK